MPDAKPHGLINPAARSESLIVTATSRRTCDAGAATDAFTGRGGATAGTMPHAAAIR